MDVALRRRLTPSSARSISFSPAPRRPRRPASGPATSGCETPSSQGTGQRHLLDTHLAARGHPACRIASASPELSIRDPPLRRTPASRSAPPTSEPPARGGAGSVRLIATLQQVVRVALIGDSQLTDTSTRPVTKLGRRLRRRGHHVDTLAVGRLDTRRALALQFRSEPADWTIFWFAVAPWMRIPPNEFATNERTSSRRANTSDILVVGPASVTDVERRWRTRHDHGVVLDVHHDQSGHRRRDPGRLSEYRAVRMSQGRASETARCPRSYAGVQSSSVGGWSTSEPKPNGVQTSCSRS